MVMQQVSARASSSSSLTVKVGDATSCSPMQIGWDASSGTGPWTVTIAPINEVPINIAIPDASGSNFQYNWTAPNYSSKTTTQAFVGVADSSGAQSGVSSLVSIGPSTQTCNAPDINLDFVWFPTNAAGLPEQCTDWSITWQKDTKDTGIEGDVTFTFLPENGTPVTVSAGKGTDKGGTFKYTIPWASGTKFAAIANDQGSSGTGGVGDLYAVTAGTGTNSCSASGNIGNGLPPASVTGSVATASASASNTKNSGANKANSTTPTASGTASTGNNNNNNAADNTNSSSSSSHSHAGAAVGATFGVLAVIALAAGLFWYLKKRNAANSTNGPYEKKGNRQVDDAYPISPWRFSSSPFDDPVTTSRTSKWFGKGGNSASSSNGFRVFGHGASNSITTSLKGPFTTAHNRHPSSYSQAGPESPSVQSPFGTASFRNVVPDDALFPPLRPIMPEMAGGSRSPESVGTPMAGLGAGIGTYDNISKQEAAAAAYNPPPPPEPRSPSLNSTVRKKPVGSKREFEKVPAKSIASTTNDYIGPIGPTKTSIYDPYTHLSQIWEDKDGVTHEIQQAGQYDVSNTSSNITSEVMMQDLSSHHTSSKASSTTQSDGDRYSHHSGEVLPYL